METLKSQVTDFLNKCEELRQSKFIVAPTKIKDVLKSIVNSQELYELFDTVVSKFDYLEVKRRCFVNAPSGSFGRSYIVLPDTVGDRLAFIFCLFVEFDSGAINFNRFLQTYYPKDSSYHASYKLFCDEVVVSLENIVRDVFAKELEEPEPAPAPVPQIAAPAPNAAAASLLGTIQVLLSREREAIAASPMFDGDKQTAFGMLDSLEAAVRNGDKNLISSLCSGYGFFHSGMGFDPEALKTLYGVVGEYMDVI